MSGASGAILGVLGVLSDLWRICRNSSRLLTASASEALLWPAEPGDCAAIIKS